MTMKNNNEEKLAREEYDRLMSIADSMDGFNSLWVGHWDDLEVSSFGKKKRIIKGDKNNFMKYWRDNQKILQGDIDLSFDSYEND